MCLKVLLVDLFMSSHLCDHFFLISNQGISPLFMGTILHHILTSAIKTKAQLDKFQYRDYNLKSNLGNNSTGNLISQEQLMLDRNEVKNVYKWTNNLQINWKFHEFIISFLFPRLHAKFKSSVVLCGWVAAAKRCVNQFQCSAWCLPPCLWFR